MCWRNGWRCFRTLLGYPERRLPQLAGRPRSTVWWRRKRNFPDRCTAEEMSPGWSLGSRRYGTRTALGIGAGLRNARAKGKHLGRPRVIVDASRIAVLRTQGRFWSEVQYELGVSKVTAQRALQARLGSKQLLCYGIFASSSLGFTIRARASSTILIRLMLRSPLSTPPT